MKNRNIFTVLFALIVVVSLAACTSNPSKQIARKWKLTQVKNPLMKQAFQSFEKAIKEKEDSINAAQDTSVKRKFIAERDSTRSMLAAMKLAVENNQKQSWINYMKDGSYESTLAGDLEKGKWSLEPGGKKLILQQEITDRKDTVIIDQLSSNKLVLVYSIKDSIYYSFVPDSSSANKQ